MVPNFSSDTTLLEKYDVCQARDTTPSIPARPLSITRKSWYGDVLAMVELVGCFESTGSCAKSITRAYLADKWSPVLKPYFRVFPSPFSRIMIPSIPPKCVKPIWWTRLSMSSISQPNHPIWTQLRTSGAGWTETSKIDWGSTVWRSQGWLGWFTTRLPSKTSGFHAFSMQSGHQSEGLRNPILVSQLFYPPIATRRKNEGDSDYD